MYIYWRVQQELNEMGSVLIFRHPNMIRELKKWVKKNAGGLAIGEELTGEDLVKMSMNNTN
jgi:hypothetical protein